MSDYRREKVLRIPFEDAYINIGNCEDMRDYFEHLEFDENNPFVGYGEVGKFMIAPTDDGFIDFVLEWDRDSCGDWGKTRSLSYDEMRRFEPVFKKLMPDCNMNAVRCVEFCFYDGCEAPSYYDQTHDPFYDEIKWEDD